ncbi:MAG: PAS domain-containing sensor histidine kinase [Ramlibacter sp.]
MSSDDHPSPDELGRMVLDKVPAMAAYWDAGLRCRYANRAHEAWFGVSPEEVIGRHVGELLGPLFPLNRPYIEAALHGEPQKFERLVPDPAGGEPRYSLANYIPHAVDGVVRGFFVLVTDISEAKRIELALRESEERFRLTLEEAPIGMATVGTDGRFLRVNRALCDLLGYSAGELVGMTLQSITHPGDRDADLAMAGQLAHGEIARYSLEKRCIRKDGRIVDVELSASAVRGVDGHPLHFIAQVEDITERKRVAAEQQFLAELGPVLASTLDPDSVIDQVVQLVTRRIADFCIVDTGLGDDDGVQRKRVAGRSGEPWPAQALLRMPIDRSKPYLLREAIRTRRPVLLQAPSDQDLAALAQGPEHLRMLKALNIGSVVSVPMVAGDRLLGGIALVASAGSRSYDDRDVRLAQELAWRVAISMENARLYAAARRASDVRDEVLAIVAHDLRNPLSAIAMQAELLRRRASPATGGDIAAAEVIERAATRMRRLIDDLLDVSRMEAVGLSVDPAPLDPGPFLSDCVESQRHLAEPAAVDLRLQAPATLPTLWADRDRMSQVFENLIGNALKFSDNGDRITIAAQAGKEDVTFSVRDTGPGIPPEHLPHLFDRFWQARRAEREGAGLGLPIVKGVVEAHGGRIWVESTPGEGSCFFFTIPRADGITPPPRRPATGEGTP